MDSHLDMSATKDLVLVRPLPLLAVPRPTDTRTTCIISPAPSPPKTARESSDGVRPDLPSLITRAVVFQSFDLAASLSPPHHSFPATFPPLSVLDHDSTSPRPLHPPHVAYVVQVSILERLQQRIVRDSELLPITVHTSRSLPVRTTCSSTQGHPPASQAPQLACRLRRGRRDCSRSGR
jgi:hypothetical protein